MRNIVLTFIIAAVCGASFVPCSRAVETQLFNGKDLTGWKGCTEFWSVKYGAITGQTTKDNPAKENTFLVWDGEVGDFELTCKYKFVDANGESKGFGNSGIQYRSKIVNEKYFVVYGYQADMDCGKTYSGMLYEEKGRGILAKRGEKVVIHEGDAPNKPKIEKTGEVGSSDDIQAAIKPADWNEYRIVAKGNHLQHFINGRPTIDVTDETSIGAKKGILALQLHAGQPMTVQFKDIVLKTPGFSQAGTDPSRSTAPSTPEAITRKQPEAQPSNPNVSQTAPALKQLESVFANEVQNKADFPLTVGTKKLKDAYRQALEAALKKSADAGRLTESLAVKEEIQNFSVRENVPETDSPGTDAEIARLRRAWRAEVARLEKEHGAVMKLIVEAHTARLRELELQLTKARNFEDAKQVREALTAVLKRQEAMAYATRIQSPPARVPNVPPPAIVTRVQPAATPAPAVPGSPAAHHAKTAAAGGESGKEFSETQPEGGVLVGLEVWKGTYYRALVIGGIRAIYKTPNGRVRGEIHGRGVGEPDATFAYDDAITRIETVDDKQQVIAMRVNGGQWFGREVPKNLPANKMPKYLSTKHLVTGGRQALGIFGAADGMLFRFGLLY